jgi:hypothetical protein
MDAGEFFALVLTAAVLSREPPRDGRRGAALGSVAIPVVFILIGCYVFYKTGALS